MRKLFVTAIVALLPLYVYAAQKTSVDQLRQILSTSGVKSDKKLAAQISGLELTDRLTRTEFNELSATLPGRKSKAALLLLADVSAFLDPPVSAILPDPPPDTDAQHQILLRAVQLANDQADMIPNFTAVRTTEHFQDVRTYPYSNKIEYYTPGSLRLIEEQTDDIRCSAGGDEVLEQPDKDLDNRTAGHPQPLMGMTIWGYHTIWGNLTWNIPNLTPEGFKPTGAFGPWLQAVTGDVPGAQREWAYWERSASGRVAVFRFRIPQEDSHYTIDYNFTENPENPFVSPDGKPYVVNPGYHGEIAIEPDTGKVARIVAISDFGPGQPLSRANIELEYGPVDVGGTSYLLPLRGVSTTSLTVATHQYLFDSGASIGELSDHFTVTSVDDLAFGSYRIYKARLRILPLKSIDRPTK
ncbi:MAG TPA: hypothetical protein VGJ21_20880 [Terracidiphilus sp.]